MHMKNTFRISKKVILAATIGNFLEIYSFSLFTMLLPTLTPVFFPSFEPIAALLSTYLVFLVGFLAYPLGALIFGFVGDKYGRREALYLSMLGMAASTFCIGFLPSYTIIGIFSPLFLASLRIIQGICAGGECMGGGILVIESTSSKHIGFYGSLVAASATFGALLASIVSAFFILPMMPIWAWRIPFVFSILIGLIGLYLRSAIEESPSFKNSFARYDHSPIKELLINHFTPFLCAVGIGALGTVPFYLIIGFLNSYLVFLKIISIQNYAILNFILLFFCASTMPLAGYIADRIGCSRIMTLSSIFSLIYVLPFFYIIYNGSFLNIILAELFFLSVSQFFVAPINAFMSQLFPIRSRYTGTAFGYCIGMALFGGTTPFISLLLIKWSGNVSSPFIYFMFICLIGIISVNVGKQYSSFKLLSAEH